MASTTTQAVLMYAKLAARALSLPVVERIFHLTRMQDVDWEETNWALLRALFEITDHCSRSNLEDVRQDR
ncbi:hypothetical protein N7447_008133 [Penicillium robsamsonii]|uniref:uncharacterized protein n=1 Tax=Penicillium robsamsonii TaxID=1792511 RepID=UPI002548EF12|nr:uncharacterized protein N7447_008133 [Penicillium robsamsonii]KAJ5815900.1 hypothetical protein N7447_008133 [Penicillium robsamsonii]